MKNRKLHINERYAEKKNIEKEEEKLDLPSLIADAVANTERIIMYGKDKPERKRSADELILSETVLSDEA